MSITIRDADFEQRTRQHAKRRNIRTLSQAVIRLAQERMLQLEMSGDGHAGDSATGQSVGDREGSSVEPRNCTPQNAA